MARSIAPHARAREDTDYGYLWWLPTYRAGGRTFTAFAMSGTDGNKAGNLTDRLLTDYLLPSLAQ